MRKPAWVALTALLASCNAVALAQAPPNQGPPGDIPDHFARPVAQDDYVRRIEMIPMRDGVRLYTVIVIPKAAQGAPIVLTRTPYDAHKAAADSDSPLMTEVLRRGDEELAQAGYIRVYQDVRGKYRSQGVYEMTRPPRGPLNASATDDTTDAWDTIDWLVKHVPQSNGRVGMIGSSYEGWTVVMALLHPHPALKAAVPESPMVDGWMGDDWFHYGAFRVPNYDYIAEQTEQKGDGDGVPRAQYDDYTTFLEAGAVGAYANAAGLDQLGWSRKLQAHPAYDSFWQDQALDRLVAQHPSDVPTMWEQGMWDQEDMWGANHSFAALKRAGHEGNNWLVIGPWFHSQVGADGRSLGPLLWQGDTAQQFRRDMVLPFFREHLQDGPPANLPRVNFYEPALNHWQSYPDWPAAQASTPLYLRDGYALSFHKPAAAGSDSYVSDPARPVPFEPRPARFDDRAAWRTWLVHDQRFVDGRPDVLTYRSAVLDKPIKLAGAPIADIVESTTGTDTDVVVKLIDVFPGQVRAQPGMGGYELPIGTDILRGRYAHGFTTPSPIVAGQPQHYRFTLPNVNYTILPGHRIMVQLQSTLFPLYDRNPQTYVASMFEAKPSDYRAATITVQHAPDAASAVWLPVVKDAAIK
ncbi:CocE/NonD family hydrolase [Lichenicoccus roseus]|uniref:CocE/NonD family hydrolase n=1 Tax=Lichenicoccus roseus TaxID=2683649 RepID=A0A5R9J9P0_9PROT|nr:CocE/NonD family hydrolase [Lichenicoccus roseus]TLU72076.1 CocE/NonD family hydrolase [Lichenicoccus roseus]